jgi:hypothetical protein
MKKRALLSAIALCFLAAGCPQKATEPPKPKDTAAVVPLPPAAPTAPAASANQDAKPAQLASSSSPQVAQADLKVFTPPPVPADLKGCSDRPGGRGCKVTLTVQGSGDPGCKITADPYHRGVFKNYKKKFIEWNIATADWQFDANGIDFGNNSQFSDGSGTGTAQYKVKDQNDATAPKQHPYKINLKHKTTGARCTKDPTVVNDVQVEE